MSTPEFGAIAIPDPAVTMDFALINPTGLIQESLIQEAEMHWGAYEIFSVISGLVLVVSAFVAPDTKVKERMWLFIGGAGFVAYGIFVAKQSEGTFTFPIYIFIIPFVFPIMFIVKAVLARRESDS
jgi:hypothetical protein